MIDSKLNQQVKRNAGRFPDDFMFQLTKDEVEVVKSQIVTSPNSNFYSGQGGGRRKPPYAFTEQGIYILATITTIIQKAKSDIILIDGYVDVNTLNILAKKDAGKKCFGISLINDSSIVLGILNRLKTI